MPDVFVSYSRRDTEFVHRLVEGLQARGKEVWLDTEGIRDGEVFPAAIRSAVEGSNAFVLVISPDSVASPFCDQEVDHALEHHKQIVPLVYRPVADGELPEPIRVRNWIPFETADGFDAGLERLIQALDTDLEWTEQHTRWLLKSREWEREGRDPSFLLRGAELAAAERWLAGEAGKDPEPTPLQREYVFASRAAVTRRMRLLVGAMGVALAVAIALGIVALTQRNAAQDNQRRAESESAAAKSRELAALSENQRAFDPELAILLGAEAVRRQPTTQAMVALRGALDASALRRTLTGHRDLVSGVSFSPDGRLVASASFDSTARVWDVRSGRLVRRVQLPDQPNHLRFAADGGMMVALDTGGTMIFDARKGKSRGQIDPLGHVSHVDGSRDGSLLVTAGPDEVVLREYPGGKVVRRFGVDGLAIRPGLSSDNRVLAAGTDTGLYVWDARTGRTLARARGGETHAAVSPDGKLVAFGGANQRIQLLSPATGRVTRTVARFPSALVISLQFSRDGRRLAAGTNDGAARIWDVRSGELLDRFEGHSCCVADVSFNLDGSLLATSSKDKTVKLWATGGNALAQARVGSGRISGAAFAGDSVVAASSREGAVAWDPGMRPRRVSGVRRARDLSVSPDGSAAVATAAGAARLFDPATGSVLRTIHPPADATAVALDGPGRLLAVGTSAGALVYATASGQQSGPSVSGTSTVRDVAFAAGRRRLATATDQGFEESLAMVFDGPTDVSTARFNQPNRIITLGFSPSGSLLAAATEADTTVKLWNVAREREARQLFGHTDEVTSIAFSPDGALIATASEDRTVRVWDAATGDELRVIQHGTAVAAVGFSPDGRRLVSGDSRGVVRVWDACSGCRRPGELLRIARERVTRGLRPAERREFLRTAP